MGFFYYKNKKVYYEEFGSGKPLLMLHGNTSSSNMFKEIINKYRDDYKVIVIDFLGHGKSDRLNEFPVDLWFDESQQVISFLKEKKYNKVYIIGVSGGALVAINVGLEAPELVDKIIVDSFEGEKSIKEFTKDLVKNRQISKENEGTRLFYQYMHGEDWEGVVDNDTKAIVKHSETIGKFFHKPLEHFKAEILLTGSMEDEFFTCIDKEYFNKVYKNMVEKMNHGEIYLFEKGGHPSITSNSEEFVNISKKFLK